MTEQHGLLHNMSAPPKSVVRFSGLAALAGLSAASAPPPDGSPAPYGRPIRFCLPSSLQGQPVDVALRLLPGLLGLAPPLTEVRLAALLNRRARELPLPDGCAVLKAQDSHELLWTDPLAALAVLTKATDTVWLRAKTPAIAAGLLRPALSLLVPPTFTGLLPRGHS